jgi:hypothetical protein
MIVTRAGQEEEERTNLMTAIGGERGKGRRYVYDGK